MRQKTPDEAVAMCREWLTCCQEQVEALHRGDWEALDLLLSRKESLQSRLEDRDIRDALLNPAWMPQGREEVPGLLEEAYRLEMESQQLLSSQMATLAQEMQSLHRRRTARHGYRPSPPADNPRFLDKRR